MVKLPPLRLNSRRTLVAGVPGVSGGPTPVTRLWRWTAVGVLVGALLALVLFAPARWLADAVQEASGGQLQLVQARGSVWRGAARLVLTGGAGSTGSMALPGIVSWRIWPTFSGAMRLQLQAECCMAQPLQWRFALVGLGGAARLSLVDSTSEWPADLLTGLGTPWNTVQPQGRLRMSTRNVQFDFPAGKQAPVFSGQLQVDAESVSSRLSTLRPMGSYRLLLSNPALPATTSPVPPATLELSTLEGSLQLTGQGQWAIGQRLRFDGIATAAPDRIEALSNLLNILGRRSGARASIKVG